jgi:hypothetical protein
MDNRETDKNVSRGEEAIEHTSGGGLTETVQDERVTGRGHR